MSSLQIVGMAGQTAEITATSGTKSASISGAVTGAGPTGPRYMMSRNPIQTEWLGLSATTKNIGNGRGWARGMYPPVFRNLSIPTSNADNQIVDSEFTDSTYRSNIFTGGTADVHRVVNGVMTMVRSSEITGGSWAKWHEWGKVDSTGFQRKFANFNEKDRAYWIGVAALDSGGLIGSVGYATFTPTGELGDSADNPNSDSFDWDYGGSLSAPSNVATSADSSGGALVNVTWDAVSGAVGYVVLVSYEDPSTHPADRHLTLADDGGVPVLSGDMVILTHRILKPVITMKSPRVFGDFASTVPIKSTPSQVDLNENLNNQFEYVAFDGDAPANNLGGFYGQTTLLADSGSTRIWRRYWHGGSGQTDRHVADTSNDYKLKFWVKASRTVDISVDLNLNGVSAEVLTLGSSWVQITRTLTPTSVSTGTSAFPFDITCNPGDSDVVICISKPELYIDGTDFLKFLPVDTPLFSSGMVLRDHDQIKPWLGTTDVECLTNPPGACPKAANIESFLRVCAQVGCDPWLQVEWYHTEQDWQDLLAYICAPVSSGNAMALKRQANGRTAPWSDAFNTIRWEFGNESWNPLEEFWNPPNSMVDSSTSVSYTQGQVYGLICRRAALAMQSSPYWPTKSDGSDKIIWVLGGRSRQSYGTNAARSFNLPCEVGIANYNGGWDEGNTIVGENSESYQNLLAVVPANIESAMDDLVSELQGLAAEDNDFVYGTTLRPTCYESGPGYQLNGLNGSAITSAEAIVQEVVMKSRAVGTSTLDTFLTQARKGFAMANFFTVNRGNDWAAGAEDSQGGGVYVSYQLPQKIEDEMGACEVFDPISIEGGTITAEDREGNEITSEQAYVHILRSLSDTGRYAIVVGNRSESTALPLTVRTNLTSAESCRVYANYGGLREHNRYSVGQRINTSGTYDADSNCVSIDIQPQQVSVPSDLSQIVIDDSLGMDETGVLPGNCVIVILDGVT